MTRDTVKSDSDDLSVVHRFTSRLEKNLVVVLGGMVIGAFLAGIGTLLFIQKVIKAEIDDHWKGQLATLAKTSVDEQIKQRFGSREPALVKHFRKGLNECTRLNDVQYCWGRETRTPKWDTRDTSNTVEHSFTFAASFEGVPVVTVGIHPARNQKIWAVYGSIRTASTFQVRARDLTKGLQSEEHVLVSYWAVGAPGKD